MSTREPDPLAAPGPSRGPWLKLIENLSDLLSHTDALPVYGRLTRASGLLAEASGLRLALGSVCEIGQNDGQGSRAWPAEKIVDAEVVSFVNDRLILMPSARTTGLCPGAPIRAFTPTIKRPKLGQSAHPYRRQIDTGRHLPIGNGLLGRVIDCAGQPLDDHGPLEQTADAPIQARRINAMDRQPINTVLHTGIRAIDGFTPLGRGQRIGLFAGAGVGKSVLLGMLAGYCDADVIVMAMVGERGREVREFVEHTLTPEARARSSIVVAPADEPPLSKVQCANYAAAIAEHYRDQGYKVLFLMDSLTRYAMALREIALATGEPPATRGYPPSVFARMPELIERSGNGRSGSGSITAIYTVLVEGDEINDPVGDAARSFLDGHLVLSRQLADAGHFPAIDIEQSISRLASIISSQQQQLAARALKAHWANYQRNRELMSIGAYSAGSDPELDRAVAMYPHLKQLLIQDIGEDTDYSDTLAQMNSLLEASAGHAGGANESTTGQAETAP